MSWTTLLLLAAGAYGFKAAGTFGLARFMSGDRARGIGALLPPALLAALIAVGTLSTEQSLVVDARLAGVAAGAVAVWRRAPFWVVVVVAAVVTAALRRLTDGALVLT